MSTAATSTRGRATRAAPVSSPIWPCSKRPNSGSPSPAGWRRRTPSCASSIPVTISSCPPTATGGRTDWRPRFTAGPAWPSTPPTCPSSTSALRPETRMVWVETPTNPLLDIIDIAAVAELAHGQDCLVVVDNTFATPWIQQPLSLGADIVVHSTTKYLGGHSDVIGGFAATNDAACAQRLGFLQNAAGAVPGPLDCFLVQRGVMTLPDPDGAPLCERARGRRPVAPPPGRGDRPPSLAGRPPPSRDRPPADAGLRRHGQLHVARRRGGGPRGVQPDPHLHPGREPRWGREPDRAPRAHDPRQRGRLEQRGPRRPGPPERRARGDRRPRRRPGPALDTVL